MAENTEIYQNAVWHDLRYIMNSGDWAVLKNGDNTYSLVQFINETDYHWGRQLSWCCLHGNQEIIEIIGQISPQDEDALEEYFYKKYYPLKSKKYCRGETGWLSPSGEWFTCNYSMHESLAYQIGILLYHSFSYGSYDLEKLGWIKIYENDSVFYDENKITSKQKEAILDISVESAEIRHNLAYLIERWNDELK